MKENRLTEEKITGVEVRTFKESAALSTDVPKSTEEAQYNIAYPLAAALISGAVGPRQVLEEYIDSEEVRDAMKKISIIHDRRFDADFPEKALSQVVITDETGREYSSGPLQARGDWDMPLSDNELKDKFLLLTKEYFPQPRGEELYQTLMGLHGEAEKPVSWLVHKLDSPLFPAE
jgi:2-methylcitrate dehydratase PrpD